VVFHTVEGCNGYSFHKEIYRTTRLSNTLASCRLHISLKQIQTTIVYLMGWQTLVLQIQYHLNNLCMCNIPLNQIYLQSLQSSMGWQTLVLNHYINRSDLMEPTRVGSWWDQSRLAQPRVRPPDPPDRPVPSTGEPQRDRKSLQ